MMTELDYAFEVREAKGAGHNVVEVIPAEGDPLFCSLKCDHHGIIYYIHCDDGDVRYSADSSWQLTKTPYLGSTSMLSPVEVIERLLRARDHLWVIKAHT